MRLDTDDQVPTQLNNRCQLGIKFSPSVDLQRREFIYSTQFATRLNARSVYTRQSLMQTMQYKHLLCRTSYASTCTTTSCYAAPIMQSTCYAKHLQQASRQRAAPY